MPCADILFRILNLVIVWFVYRERQRNEPMTNTSRVCRHDSVCSLNMQIIINIIIIIIIMTIVPVVIGALGVVKKGIKKHNDKNY